MSLLLAAIGAMVAALLELTIGSYVRVGGAQPHLVLVFGVIWTIAAGLDAGLAWAFAGGLLLDILAPRPLGSSAFALLVSVSITAVAARPFSRIRAIAPVILVPILTVVNSLLLLATLSALQPGVAPPEPFTLILPGAVYDTLLAAVFGPLIVALRDRTTDQERAGW